MSYELYCGRSRTVSLNLSGRDVLFDLDVGDAPPLPDVALAVKSGFEKPIGATPVEKMLGKNGKVVILVDDLTRSTPQRILLPIVLDEFNRIGVKDKQITVIIALGTHRPMTEAEIRERYGAEVLDRVPVVNHEYDKHEKLVDLGRTPNGTPLMINKEVYTADFSMGVGNIIPHLIAGWSGGGKIIQPGVCGEETTGMTHVLAGTEGADTLLGNLNQKVRREIDEVATRAGLKLVLNTVLNKREEMAQVFIGHHVEALKEGVRFAERIYKRRIPARADIVVASSYPADLDYWQAIKGVVSASFAVKRGGTIFLITPCPEKISPTHPELEKIGSLSLADSLRMVQTGEFRDKVACGVCLFHARLRERFKIIVYSVGMSRREVEALGLTYAHSVKEGMRLAYESQRENAAIGVIRNSEVLPYLA